MLCSYYAIRLIKSTGRAAMGPCAVPVSALGLLCCCLCYSCVEELSKSLQQTETDTSSPEYADDDDFVRFRSTCCVLVVDCCERCCVSDNHVHAVFENCNDHTSHV
jgi:hypothetical protein